MDYKEKVIALLNSQELSKEQKEKLEKIFPELKEEESVDKHYHLWTIQDAKDGDVLVILPKKGSESNEQIFLFKAINSRDYVDNCIEYYCRLCDGAFYKNKTGYMGTTLDTFYPATKKQRDLLFQKMKEAGYEMADSHPHWISVEDKEPPKGQWIITYEPTSPIVIGTDIILPDETADEHHITHWMPLPEAPLVTDLNKKDLPPVSWQEGNILVEEEGGEKMDFFTWKERYEYYRTKGYEQGYEDAINKACEWLGNDFEELTRLHLDDIVIDKFCKAMKGGEE